MMSLPVGSVRSMFLRLCVRAPRTTRWALSADAGGACPAVSGMLNRHGDRGGCEEAEENRLRLSDPRRPQRPRRSRSYSCVYGRRFKLPIVAQAGRLVDTTL